MKVSVNAQPVRWLINNDCRTRIDAIDHIQKTMASKLWVIRFHLRNAMSFDMVFNTEEERDTDYDRIMAQL